MADVAPGDVAEAAAETVRADGSRHGDAYENHRSIAAVWTWFLDDKLYAEIEPWEVAIMMTLLKASRLKNGHVYEDHFEDIAGYADCGWRSAVANPTTEAVHDE